MRSMVYTTIYYPDIRNLDIYVIIARPYPILDKQDHDRGYVRKGDLWAVTNSLSPLYLQQFFPKPWSTIVEYRITIYENHVTEWEKTRQYQVF